MVVGIARTPSMASTRELMDNALGIERTPSMAPMRESMDLALSLDKKQSTAHLTQEGPYKSKNVITQPKSPVIARKEATARQFQEIRPTSQDAEDQDIDDKIWWKEHKETIVDLYINKLYSLKAVKRAVESDGLHRT